MTHILFPSQTKSVNNADKRTHNPQTSTHTHTSTRQEHVRANTREGEEDGKGMVREEKSETSVQHDTERIWTCRREVEK